MASPHGSFIWYELLTPDPKGAKHFYDAVVGWNVQAEADDELDYRIIAAKDGDVGGVMGLTPEMQAAGARPAWLGYVGVDDVDATLTAATAAGGAVLMEPRDVPNVGRIGMMADPDGAPIYVMRGASDGSSGAYAPMAPGHCAWNELAARTMESMVEFYGSLFGWTRGDSMPMGDMGAYQFILQRGSTIGAMMTASPDKPPRWRYYFRVGDASAAAKAVTGNGGVIVHGPAEVPGGDRIIVGTDPQGAEFALVGR